MYSAELGYDPDEWEECPPPDHFLAFGWFTRLVLAVGAIGFAFLFFYVLERRKVWVREERRASFSLPSINPDDLDALIAKKERERSKSSQRRLVSPSRTQGPLLSTRRPKKRMSEADMAALLEWERGLKEIEDRRLEEAKEIDRRAAPSLRASAPPQQHRFQTTTSDASSDDAPPTMTSVELQPKKRSEQLQQQFHSIDSPLCAPTPPSTPPGPPVPPHASQLHDKYEKLARDLQHKLAREIEMSNLQNADELHAQLQMNHEAEVRAAESGLRAQGQNGAEAAQQFRRNFEDQINSMMKEYNRHLNPVNAHMHSSNESDVEPFEQIGASPTRLYSSESDDPENEPTSFTYEASPRTDNSEKRHVQTTVVMHQHVNSATGVDTLFKANDVPELLVNDCKPAVGVKKSSSSSEESFVKIYSDLIEKIDENTHRAQKSSARAEAQLREMLREYANVSPPSLDPAEQSGPATSTTQAASPMRYTFQKSAFESTSKSPQGSQPSSSRHSPDIDVLSPTQPLPQVSVSLIPLVGFQGNFLQQYQQGPDGRLYPQGPDGMFYKQNKKGQLIPISSELQDILQKQQQSGLQQPLIKTTDGNIYQQDANGQFYEQAADGQMYKVPPNVQRLIQQEIQQTLQMGERKPTEPQELVKGPDGITYEKGPLGQFYEQGPDGRLHRVSRDIQRQLLDLVEKQKRKDDENPPLSTEPEDDPSQKRFAQTDLDPAVIQSPDGKIYEMASDGQFYQLDGERLCRIPQEMQPILKKQHKKFMDLRQRKASEKRPKKSVEEDTPPFDPDYPYHPRRRQPMQPPPNAPAKSKANTSKRQLDDHEKTASDLAEASVKPKSLDAKDVSQVQKLLEEYDLSASIDAPHYDVSWPNLSTRLDKRDDPEHQSPPKSSQQLLKTPNLEGGPTTPSPAFENSHLLQMGEETKPELHNYPQKLPLSPPHLQIDSPMFEPDDQYQVTTLPLLRKTSKSLKTCESPPEQLHRDQIQKPHSKQREDPRRLIEAEIYLQDAIDYNDNQQQMKGSTQSGFVMEEDMLSTSEKLPLKMQNASMDATSRLISTNDVFEKSEPEFVDDVDDAVTFAPDIQTVEIPPDQISQNSSNYIENLPDEDVYIDHAVNCHQQATSPDRQMFSVKTPHPENLTSQSKFSPETAFNTAGSFDSHCDLNESAHPQRKKDDVEVQGVSGQLDTAVANAQQIPSAAAMSGKTSSSNIAAKTSPQPTTTQPLSTDNAEHAHNDDKETGEPLGDFQLLRMHSTRREPSFSPFKDASDQHPAPPQFWRRRRRKSQELDDASVSSSKSSHASTRSIQKQSSLMSAMGCTSIQEMMLGLTSIEELSDAMAKAGLERTNLIFGIDYTASNKYQGEHSFDGRSLHFVDDLTVENPYQQVIKIMGRSLAPFTSSSTGIPVYGFGDNESGDWGVFPLNGTTDGVCRDLGEVLSVYNKNTPNIALGGPTNFAPLIYQAIQICQRVQDYHILVIIADGQVTNERATRKAIVQACQFPLSIIVVGVGDGPWEMMKLFDESLPKRPWDNFHFCEYRQLVKSPQSKAGEVAFAIHTLLEVPDQYRHIVNLGMLPLNTYHKEDSRRSTPLKNSPI